MQEEKKNRNISPTIWAKPRTCNGHYSKIWKKCRIDHLPIQLIEQISTKETKEKIDRIVDYTKLEQEIYRKIKDSINISANNCHSKEGENCIGNICLHIKKYITDSGKQLERKVTKIINNEIQKMTNDINHYEKKMQTYIRENKDNLSKFLGEYSTTGVGNIYKYLGDIKGYLELREITLRDSIFEEVENKQKKIGDIVKKIIEPVMPNTREIIEIKIKRQNINELKRLYQELMKYVEIAELYMKTLANVSEDQNKHKKESINRKEPRNVETIREIISGSAEGLIFRDSKYKEIKREKWKRRHTKLEYIGNNILAASKGKDVEIYDIGRKEVLYTILGGHSKYIRAMTLFYETTGQVLIITGSEDKTIRIWRGPECVFGFKGHTGSINCLLMHPSGVLLSGSSDKTVRMWKLNMEKAQALIKHKGTLNDLVLLSNWRILSVCGEGGDLYIWHLERGILKEIHYPSVESRGFLCGLGVGAGKGKDKGEGRRVLLGGVEGNLMLLGVGAGVRAYEGLRSSRGSTSFGESRAFGEERFTRFSGGSVWSMGSGGYGGYGEARSRSLGGGSSLTLSIANLHVRGVTQIRRGNLGEYITAGGDGLLKVINYETFTVVRVLRGHSHAVLALLPIFSHV